MARTSDASRDDVRVVYDRLRAGDAKVTGQSLFDEMKLLNGGRVVRQLRTVQDDLAKFRIEDKDGRPFKPEIWNKWEGNDVPMHSMSRVLFLNSINWVLVGQPFSQHEAMWAGRICADLDELDPTARWFVVWAYSVQHVVRHISTRKSPGTFHLDQLLGYKPWKSENREIWDLWIRSPVAMSGGFYPALQYLRRLILPPGVDRSLAVWATTELIGPWVERPGAWAWARVLRNRYGDLTKQREKSDET